MVSDKKAILILDMSYMLRMFRERHMDDFAETVGVKILSIPAWQGILIKN